MDDKAQMVGEKYNSADAISELEDVGASIKKRIRKKGEQLPDEDFNGIKNFPKLCVKLLLEKPFFSDMLKANQIQAELDPNGFESNAGSGLMLGALSSMASKVVSAGQAKSSAFKLDDAVVWVAGRMGNENFKTIMEMAESYKSVEGQSTEERLDLAKKTALVFPGIT